MPSSILSVYQILFGALNVRPSYSILFLFLTRLITIELARGLLDPSLNGSTTFRQDLMDKNEEEIRDQGRKGEEEVILALLMRDGRVDRKKDDTPPNP